MLNNLRISLVTIFLWLHEQLTIFILWGAKKELKHYEEYYKIMKAEKSAGEDFTIGGYGENITLDPRIVDYYDRCWENYSAEDLPEEFKDFLEGI